MPEWPKTKEQLQEAGYSYLKRGTCAFRECSVPLVWAKTPGGKSMPLNRVVGLHGGPTTWEPHFATCLPARREAEQRRKDSKGDVNQQCLDF